MSHYGIGFETGYDAGYNAGYSAGHREARQLGQARMRDAMRVAQAFQQQARSWTTVAKARTVEVENLRASLAGARQQQQATDSDAEAQQIGTDNEGAVR